MIKIITDYNDMPCIHRNDFYGTKIISLYKAYGFTKYTDYWKQNENTVIARLYDSFIVYCNDGKCDAKELNEFLVFMGFHSLVCKNSLKILTDYKSQATSIMCLNKLISPVDRKADYQVIINPDLRSVYSLIKECESDSFYVPEFEGFFLDASLKIRRECGLAIGIFHNHTLVSAALANDITEKSAIITVAASAKQYRHKGFGSIAVCELIKNIGINKTIFVERNILENKEFYEGLGFYDIIKGKIIEV